MRMCLSLVVVVAVETFRVAEVVLADIWQSRTLILQQARRP
jgi:hypothetical protein